MRSRWARRGKRQLIARGSGVAVVLVLVLGAPTLHGRVAAQETLQKPGQIPRIAYLGPGPPRCESPGDSWFAIKAAFLDGLKQAGFAPTLTPELQWMAPHFAKRLGASLWEPQKAPLRARPVLWQPQCFQDDTMVTALVADLLRREPAVIMVNGTPAALAAQRGTKTVPIVFAGVGDPVGSALVPSLARPGGNVTGVANLQRELVHKRVELLTEFLPGIRHVAALVDPVLARSVPYLWAGTEEAARAKGIDLKRCGFRKF